MTERELGKALLRLDVNSLAGVPDMRQQALSVLERDRGRIRVLSGLAIATWVFAVALVLTVLVWFGLLFPKQAKVLMDFKAGQLTAAQRDALQIENLESFAMGTVTITLSVGVLAAAALCTMLLVSATRRATLRQINACLMEISSQLGQLRGGGAGAAS